MVEFEVDVDVKLELMLMLKLIPGMKLMLNCCYILC